MQSRSNVFAMQSAVERICDAKSLERICDAKFGAPKFDAVGRTESRRNARDIVLPDCIVDWTSVWPNLARGLDLRLDFVE